MLRLPGKSAAGLNFGFSEAAHTVCEGELFLASALGPQGSGMPVLPAGQWLGLGKEWTGLPLGPAVMLPRPPSLSCWGRQSLPGKPQTLQVSRGEASAEEGPRGLGCQGKPPAESCLTLCKETVIGLWKREESTDWARVYISQQPHERGTVTIFMLQTGKPEM